MHKQLANRDITEFEASNATNMEVQLKFEQLISVDNKWALDFFLLIE